MADKRTSPLEKIRAENAEKAQKLGQMGAVLHPLTIIQAMLTVLVEGLGFSYELEKELQGPLDQALQEANARKAREILTLPDNYGKVGK